MYLSPYMCVHVSARERRTSVGRTPETDSTARSTAFSRRARASISAASSSALPYPLRLCVCVCV